MAMRKISSLTDKRIIRDSNIELARIIAMSMVVIGHFIVHGIWGGGFCTLEHMSSPINCILENLVYSLCVCGVNIFVLISGYYKIKVNLRSLISFILLCAFYGVVAYIYTSLCISKPMSLIGVIKSCLVSNSHWFFKAYFGLLLLSPILNSAAERMTIKEFRRSLVLICFLNCVCGWIFNNINENGYNIIQLIFIYWVGAWIRKDEVISKYTTPVYFITFISLSISIFFASILCLYISKGSNWPIYFYNNPLVVAASVAFFLGFTRIKIHSLIVNSIASTVVAALFIQDFIFPQKIYALINEAYTNSVTNVVLCCILLFALIFIVAFIVENLRRTMCKPLLRYLDAFVTK